MTIRMLQAWNGLHQQKIVTTLSGSDEAALVAAGIATYDLDGQAENLRMAQLATDAAGNTLAMSIHGRNGSLPIPQAAATVLKKWRAALAKVRDGQSNAKLAMFGDSTFLGSGATGVAGYPAGGRSKGPCVKLADMLNSYFCQAVSHAVIGTGNNASLFTWDPRFVQGAGWSFTTLNNVWGISAINNSTTTNNLTFTPSGSVDTFVVWYTTTSGSARSFNWSVDAGGTTNINCNVAKSMASVVIPAGAAGTHTLNLARVAGSVYILGIQAYNSSTKCVEVLNMGRSGGRASQATSSNTEPWDALNALPLFAPDLTVINLTINEWLNAGTVDAWKIHMQQIIDVAKTTGDVILMAGVPSKINQAALAYQSSFAAAAGELAAANGLPFLDVFGRFGSQESISSLYTDDIHPNGAGYADMISPLYNLITQL
jgi:lysophospholipase L1-like esterase